MPLPKISLPTYKAKLYSRDEEITFRPYTVKEEKHLLMALESNEEKEIIGAIENLVEACVLDEMDVKQLPSFDLEQLFLQIRCRSISQVAELRISYAPCGAGKPACLQEFAVDLSQLKVSSPENHTKKIQITPSIGVVMRYPSIAMFEKLGKLFSKEGEIEAAYDIIARCIESVWEGKKVIVADTVKHSELKEFIESLSREQFSKIIQFFETMPAVKTNLKKVCGECGKEIDMEVKGLSNFFA